MSNTFKKVSIVVLIMAMLAGILAKVEMKTVSAETSAVLTSSEISVEGYQMKTYATSEEGVTFRAVCKAPDIGSVITVDGKEYTVKSLGTIYTKDPNRNGKSENKVLTKSYTELDSVPYPTYAIKDGYGFKYIGQKNYQNKMVTFGYISTEAGIVEQKDGYTTYIRTMTNMDDYVLNTLWIRAFVEAIDEDGNETLIYGEKAAVTSVAKIAYQVYIGGKATNAEGHKYLYDTILSKLPESNPYYLDTEQEYGWGDVVVPVN